MANINPFATNARLVNPIVLGAQKSPLSEKKAPLDAADRKSLKKSQFGLPGERKYPMPDASHAGNAKARAKAQFNKGKLSRAKLDKINAKANKILKK